MAHVRAASPGTGVSRENCHPFQAGRLLFCHNGRIGSFSNMRRAVMARMSDEAFAHVRGTTDSERIFGLILTYLGTDKQGTMSPLHQTKPFGHKRLVVAMKMVLREIEILLEEHGLNGPENFTTLNFSLTDGDTMAVCRYCDKSPAVPPLSLYFAFGNAQRLYAEVTSEEMVMSSGCSSDCGGIGGDTASETESDDGLCGSQVSSISTEN
jgi:predicted glutamine amidotransferase